MAAKAPNPVIEEILTASENSLIIVKNPNGIGDDTFRVYSSGDHATLLDNKEELKGFEKSLKMQKITAQLVAIENEDWDISWAWSLQANIETLAELLKSADKLKMEITLTDEIIGKRTEEDMPRPKKSATQTIGDGLVSVSHGPGVWSGSMSDFEDLMKKNGMPGFGSEDDDDSSSGPGSHTPTAEEIIKAMEDGTFEGDPIEGLWEIGKALANEQESEEEGDKNA